MFSATNAGFQADGVNKRSQESEATVVLPLLMNHALELWKFLLALGVSSFQMRGKHQLNTMHNRTKAATCYYSSCAPLSCMTGDMLEKVSKTRK